MQKTSAFVASNRTSGKTTHKQNFQLKQQQQQQPRAVEPHDPYKVLDDTPLYNNSFSKSHEDSAQRFDLVHTKLWGASGIEFISYPAIAVDPTAPPPYVNRSKVPYTAFIGHFLHEACYAQLRYAIRMAWPKDEAPPGRIVIERHKNNDCYFARCEHINDVVVLTERLNGRILCDKRGMWIATTNEGAAELQNYVAFEAKRLGCFRRSVHVPKGAVKFEMSNELQRRLRSLSVSTNSAGSSSGDDAQ